METKSGFTLIELLIVLTILAVMAIIGLNSFINSLSRGRDSRRKADLNQLKNSLRMYYNDYQTYPDEQCGKILITCNRPGQVLSWGDQFNCGTNIYMKELPQEPLSPSLKYYYDKISDDSYTLYTCLENTGDTSGTSSCSPLGPSCGREDDFSCGNNWCYQVSAE